MSILNSEQVKNEIMYPIVKQIKSKLKKGNTIFISKFGNTDLVLKGMNLLSRAEIVDFDKNAIVLKLDNKIISKIKKDTQSFSSPVFYSTIGVDGVGIGYIVEVGNNLVLVSANSEYLKGA